MSQGKKNDKDKLRYDLIDPHFLEGLAAVLTMGAKKYDANNWQQVDDPFNRYYAALCRHLTAHRMGNVIDKESGLPHISHVACNVMFLHHFIRRKLYESIDIRPDENRDSSMLGKLRGIIEQSMLNDHEENDPNRSNVRAAYIILSELKPHFSVGAFDVHNSGDGNFQIFFGPDNTPSYYVSHISKSTLSELQRLANCYITKEIDAKADG